MSHHRSDIFVLLLLEPADEGPVPPTECLLVTMQGTFIVTAQGTNIAVNCTPTINNVVDIHGNQVVDINGNTLVALVE
jgi:hypothetical protein